ncbi:molybdopterin-binding protein [Streptomyces sp. S1]|uniref:TOBE domain-containing protein n=1 Tax=Streptomyces sp. S1 TaxID=718288 RepID=UPI000EF7D0BA|nr:TOBE domain-containing protein [Streptomyces sp. S1]
MSMIVRNQLVATVDSITLGGDGVHVGIRIARRRKMNAILSPEAFKNLDLHNGCSVRVLFPSNRVSLATGTMKRLSIRNQLVGSVAEIRIHGALALVRVDVEGRRLVATVTKDAVSALGLEPESFVVVLIDTMDISLDAVEGS